MQRLRTPAAALASVAVIALSGCGQATSGAGSAPPTASESHTSPAPLKPAALVRAVLPRSVAGTQFVKMQMETIKDQLAPAGTPRRAAFNAVVHRSWQASGHSIFRLNGLRVAALVDVNVFDSMADATRMFRLEFGTRPPHSRVVMEPTPLGAAPGSKYACSGKKGYSGCSLQWRQGRVIGYVAVLGTGQSAFNPGVAAGLAPRLLSMQVQVVNRILDRTHVAPGQ